MAGMVRRRAPARTLFAGSVLRMHFRRAAPIYRADVRTPPVSLAMPAQDRLARVRLGPIADAAAVHAMLDRLKRSGFAEAFVVGPEQDLPTDC